ncbi:MAG: hypothetical protein ACREFR_17515 [Limisphaerales bacterium]
MSFRIAYFQGLLLAALVFRLLPAAKAQAHVGAGHIIFSTPDGRISSNAPLPMVQAPEAPENPSLPDHDAIVNEFSDLLVAPTYPPPIPMLRPNARHQDDFRDSMDTRKQMGELTPAQIMSVPTSEQIFGLPEKVSAQDTQRERGFFQPESGAATNSLNFDSTPIFAQTTWVKDLSQEQGKSDDSSNTTRTASGFFSRLFDSAPDGNGLSGFGDHDSSGNAAFWSAPRPAPQPSSWDSDLTSGALTPPAPVAEITPNPIGAQAQSTSEFASQSPFTPPQPAAMDTLPKLPPVPSVSPQNSAMTQPASAPSWEPRPPPWTQAQTPFGAPVQLNPALQR